MPIGGARTRLHQPPLVGRRVGCLTDHSFLPHSAPFDVRLDWQLADDCGTRSNFARAPAKEKRRKTTDISPSTSESTEIISHTYERRKQTAFRIIDAGVTSEVKQLPQFVYIYIILVNREVRGNTHTIKVTRRCRGGTVQSTVNGSTTGRKTTL